MANLTTSSDIDTFMGSANNAAARTNLGVLPLAGGTLTGQLIQSTNGAASTPPLLLNGTIFTGGSATTTKPLFLIEPTGTTSTGWNTSGTMFGVNAPSGFAGVLATFKDQGNTRLSIDVAGGLQWDATMNTVALSRHGSGLLFIVDSSFSSKITSAELRLTSAQACVWTDGSAYAGATITSLRQSTGASVGSPCLQLGADAAGVTNQHFKACNRITSNGVGANLTISGGNGRGGAGGSLILATYDTGASATPGTLLTRLTLDTAGMLTFANGVNMSFASTMIGGANTDALAFWGTSPVTQPAHIADPTGDSGTGLDTVDKTVLDTTLTDIQASIASINAMLAITGLTAAI